MVPGHGFYPHLVTEPNLGCLWNVLQLLLVPQVTSTVSRDVCEARVQSNSTRIHAKAASGRFSHWVIIYRFQKYILLWVWHSHRQQHSGKRQPQYTRTSEIWQTIAFVWTLRYKNWILSKTPAAFHKRFSDSTGRVPKNLFVLVWSEFGQTHFWPLRG